MKTIRMGFLLGASMLVVVSAAQAADPVNPEPAAIDWSGFYAGLHGGWGWADAPASYNSAANENCFENDSFFPGGCAVDLKPNGGLLGAQAGFNFVFDNGLVLGLEGDFGFANIKDDGQSGNPDSGGFNFLTDVDQEVDKLASVRGRLGVAVGNFLPFVTAGWGWAHGKRSAFGDFVDASESNWHDGWVVGGGAEYAIDENWSVKAEYRYYDLGKEEYMFNAITEGTDVDLDIQTIQVGVNFNF